MDGVERLAQPPLGLHVQQPLDAHAPQRLGRRHMNWVMTFTNSALPGAAMPSSVSHGVMPSPQRTRHAEDAVQREALQHVQRPLISRRAAEQRQQELDDLEPDGVDDEAPELVASLGVVVEVGLEYVLYIRRVGAAGS
jgi:hypothetical protein